MTGLQEAFYVFSRFIESGGDVLLAIMVLAFILWSLILERFIYLATSHKRELRRVLEAWEARSDHRSWHAHKIREKLIAEVKLGLESTLGMIGTFVALCPLLGLLGTVTGMIEVFDVMAVTGSSNARAMAGGVSKATVPTMAGMTVAISGLYFSYRLQRKAKIEIQKISDRLVLS